MARVVVIGGGFGGLASALRLAKLGHDVTLVEERELGGALVPVTADGFTWDVVAHTLLPAVVRDLFRKTGRPLEKELDLVQLDCVREHWFADGSALVLPAGRAAQLQAFDTLGPGLGQPWLDHVQSYADDWEALRRGYLEVPWDPDALPREVAARLDSRETLLKRLRRSLRDPRARLVAAYPFEADGHHAPRRARLGRAHVVPRAALRRVGRGRRDRRTPGGAGTPARHPRRRRRGGSRGRHRRTQRSSGSRHDERRRARRRRRGLCRRPASAPRAGAATSRARRPRSRPCCATSASRARCATCPTSWSSTARHC